MNKNFHYKPGNVDRNHMTKHRQVRKNLIRLLKKKIRRIFKKITPEDMEE